MGEEKKEATDKGSIIEAWLKENNKTFCLRVSGIEPDSLVARGMEVKCTKEKIKKTGGSDISIPPPYKLNISIDTKDRSVLELQLLANVHYQVLSSSEKEYEYILIDMLQEYKVQFINTEDITPMKDVPKLHEGKTIGIYYIKGDDNCYFYDARRKESIWYRFNFKEEKLFMKDKEVGEEEGEEVLYKPVIEGHGDRCEISSKFPLLREADDQLKMAFNYFWGYTSFDGVRVVQGVKLEERRPDRIVRFTPERLSVVKDFLTTELELSWRVVDRSHTFTPRFKGM